LTTGSGFFWQHADRTLLLTNWHILSGRNPLTGAPLDERTAAIPNRLEFMAYKLISAPDARGMATFTYNPVAVNICDDDLTAARWLEHPTFGRRVDVGALDISDAVKGAHIRCVNTLESNAALPPQTGQDVFVLGFPFGPIAGAHAPVWKRGSIALDPTYDVDGLPKVLIDTATRPGMSGSVVIARHIVVGTAYEQKDGSKSETMLYAQLDLVLGIYSGRHYPDFEKAQLGIVWKRRAIEETVASGVIANP